MVIGSDRFCNITILLVGKVLLILSIIYLVEILEAPGLDRHGLLWLRHQDILEEVHKTTRFSHSFYPFLHRATMSFSNVECFSFLFLYAMSKCKYYYKCSFYYTTNSLPFQFASS